MDAKQFYLSKPWLRYYPQSVPADAEIPEQSIPELFDQVTEKWSGKDALIFYGKKITYGEMRDLVDRFAAALAALGVTKGDCVALHLLNCPQVRNRLLRCAQGGSDGDPDKPRVHEQ